METAVPSINFIKRMPNDLIQFRNAIKLCKVFRAHEIGYKGICLLYMLSLLIIIDVYLCSECATSIWFTCQLSCIHRPIEAT